MHYGEVRRSIYGEASIEDPRYAASSVARGSQLREDIKTGVIIAA
jgi:hypothetical protein